MGTATQTISLAKTATDTATTVRRWLRLARLLPAPALFVLLGCGLELPEQDVSYSDHIVPLVARDCAFCHENGEFDIKLQGLSEDYDTLRRFSCVDQPQVSPVLSCGSGDVCGYEHRKHPILWPEDSLEHTTVKSWMVEGTRRVAVDPVKGECQSDDDCPQSTIVCSDWSVRKGRECRLNAKTGKGHCVRDDCEGSKICKGAKQPPKKVSFEKHIVPLIKADCASCHSKGQSGVKLTGSSADYSEVMFYVRTDDPEGQATLLWWARGGIGKEWFGQHPATWSEGRSKVVLVLQWIRQGALK